MPVRRPRVPRLGLTAALIACALPPSAFADEPPAPEVESLPLPSPASEPPAEPAPAGPPAPAATPPPSPSSDGASGPTVSLPSDDPVLDADSRFTIDGGFTLDHVGLGFLVAFGVRAAPVDHFPLRLGLALALGGTSGSFSTSGLVIQGVPQPDPSGSLKVTRVSLELLAAWSGRAEPWVSAGPAHAAISTEVNGARGCSFLGCATTGQIDDGAANGWTAAMGLNVSVGLGLTLGVELRHYFLPTQQLAIIPVRADAGGTVLFVSLGGRAGQTLDPTPGAAR
jgi:hypothetical protein